MSAVYKRVLDRIFFPSREARDDARDRCLGDLERVLSVLDKLES